MEGGWSDREAAELVARLAPRWGEDLALRVYTSRLIGRDPDLVLHGGGKTSLKGTVTTLVGERVEALFVKGSGWDLAAIEPPGLPAVDLVHLRKLRALHELSDEEMVNQLRTHLFDAGAPNPSVETLLHAFLPHRFIDHTHADIALVLTNQPPDECEAMVRDAFGPRWAVVPYVMPGFALAKLAAEVFERDPAVEGLVLLNHGLFTFADDARTAYGRMIAGVDRAERYAQGRERSRRPVAGGADRRDRRKEEERAYSRPQRGAHAPGQGNRDLDRPIHTVAGWRSVRHGVLASRAGEARQGEAIAARGAGGAGHGRGGRDRLRHRDEADRGGRARRAGRPRPGPPRCCGWGARSGRCRSRGRGRARRHRRALGRRRVRPRLPALRRSEERRVGRGWSRGM